MGYAVQGLDTALDLAPDARAHAVDFQRHGFQGIEVVHRILRWVNRGIGF